MVQWDMELKCCFSCYESWDVHHSWNHAGTDWPNYTTLYILICKNKSYYLHLSYVHVADGGSASC